MCWRFAFLLCLNSERGWGSWQNSSSSFSSVFSPDDSACLRCCLPESNHSMLLIMHLFGSRILPMEVYRTFSDPPPLIFSPRIPMPTILGLTFHQYIKTRKFMALNFRILLLKSEVCYQSDKYIMPLNMCP